MWFLISVVATIAAGTRRIYEKGLSFHFGAFVLPLLVNTLTLIPLAVCLFFFPLPTDIWHLSSRFWWPLLLNALILFPFQVSFYLRAIRDGEISAIMPLTALTPLFNLVSSFILLREIPTTFGFLGIGIVVFAAFLLLWKKGARIRLGPELLIITSTLIFAVCSSLDKMAIEASTPIFYIFANTFFSGISLFIGAWITGQLSQVKKARLMPKSILITSFLLFVSFAGLELAFSLGPTSYVLAVRTGSFVIATLWGILKLKEQAPPRKIAAIVFFILGSILLAFA